MSDPKLPEESYALWGPRAGFEGINGVWVSTTSEPACIEFHKGKATTDCTIVLFSVHPSWRERATKAETALREIAEHFEWKAPELQLESINETIQRYAAGDAAKGEAE